MAPGFRRNSLPISLSAGHSITRALVRRLSTPAALMVAGIVLIAIHQLFAADMFSYKARFLAGILALASYISILQVSVRRERGELPFREWYVILFYIFFGLPVFWDDALPLVGATYIPATEALDLALLAAVLSIGIFYVAYPIGVRMGRASRPVVTALLPKTLPSGAAWFLLAVLVPIVMYATYKSMLAPEDIPESIQKLLLVTVSATLLLAVALRLADLTNARNYHLAAWIAFVISTGIGVLTGMLESFLLPIAVVAISRWLSSKRSRLIWVLAGLVLFIILNPAKLAYRQDAAELSGRQGTLTVSERSSIWLEALSSKWGPAENVEENLDSSRSRMADLLPVAQVIDYVPNTVPYAKGEPWLAIIYSFIPRAIWPDKPDLTEMTNAAYALTFERQTVEQVKVTTFNLPQLADGYWNLGWAGVIIVAILAGLSVGFKAGAFDTKGWATCAIAIVFFTSMRPQGDVTTLIAGSVQMYVGAIVFLHILVLGGRVFQLGRWQASSPLAQRGAGVRSSASL